MIDHRRLLLVALDLVAVEEPSEAALRRAVSTVYYACFHRLQRLVADTLAPTVAGSAGWTRLYRALDHGYTRSQLTAFAQKQSSIAPFSQLFSTLLDDRHRADYDPTDFKLSQRDVILLIEQVVDAGEALNGLDHDKQVELAALLLTPERKPERRKANI